ncbi:MAG: hypothetical protein M1829_004962 [Trizodia sp. TS-e1964]|nr:MAG: hypothetical protein M1829_004962 [Trizodia sp. TS-e1964]
MDRNINDNHMGGSNSNPRSNILASSYLVNAASGSLTGLHYSTTGAGGKSLDSLWCIFSGPGPSGVPEVGSGIPLLPQSPPLSAHGSDYSGRKSSKGSRGGAVYTITEGCERLFCDALKAVFLGERALAPSSLVTGANLDVNNNCNQKNAGLASSLEVKSPHSVEATELDEWMEVWDYVGGCSFRGFVANKPQMRTLFVFFEKGVAARDLKPGLMSLIELASEPLLDCSRLVVCLDRTMDDGGLKSVVRDLGWVGFELVTLDDWCTGENVVSNNWLFLGMEI